MHTGPIIVVNYAPNTLGVRSNFQAGFTENAITAIYYLLICAIISV